MNLEDLKSWTKGARCWLDEVVGQENERVRQMSNLQKLLQSTGDLIELVEDLRVEVADLRSELEEQTSRRQAAETRLSELNKLSAGVAKKSPQDDLFRALRSYLNISRRKTQSKREAAKMVFMELFASAKLELPEDISELLEHLDDEQTEPRVVNVTGDYNDIHDNDNVKMEE